MVLIEGKLHSKLYHLHASVVEGEVVVASGKSDLNQYQLCHLRLGHMNDKRLSLLGKQNLLNGTRVKFSKKVERKTRDKLDYIYSNLWGPNRVPSKSSA
uniref:Uncharacterized mitochondrial protein AtMg00300-like n=1 Tax=Nicotiana tabacum TaxID=4097 RepID=A0A1S4A290_TOBAC